MKILKKLSLICFAVCFGVISFLGLGFSKSSKSQASATSTISSEELTSNFMTYMQGLVNSASSRIAGSDGEKLASIYIYGVLESLGLEAVSLSQNGTDGYQTFTFVSALDGENHSSQNVVFELKSANETEKTVILGTSYDAFAFDADYNIVSTDGVNGSAGSVATLLTLANALKDEQLQYNVMFVFFGAGESDSAGAKVFTDGLSSEMQENILLFLNFDKITLGENVYFYVDEISNDLSDYSVALSNDNNLGAQEIDLSHLAKITLSQENDLGLTYTHIAQNQTVIDFMKLGVLSMNIFSGDYSTGIVVGRSEYSGKDLVTYTTSDNLSYLTNLYGIQNLTQNLVTVFNFSSSLLLSEDFVSVCESSVGSSSAFYSFFGNQNLITYLTLIMIFVFIIVALIVHYFLAVRSFGSNLEVELTKSIFDISMNFDEIPDEEKGRVTKIVGQIIVNDLKKSQKHKGKSDDKN